MLDGHIAQPDESLKEWWPYCPFRPQGRTTMRDVARFICEKHGITFEELTGDRRMRHISWPRQEFMALASALPHTSSPMIGRFLGRDHATVLHGVKAHYARAAQ